jgi:hypothetical protein
MKITVDLSENDLRDICRFTGLKKKGPAIRKLVVDALMLQRRREMTEKFVSGEWGLDLPSSEETRAHDRKTERSQYHRHGRHSSPHRTRHLRC